VKAKSVEGSEVETFGKVKAEVQIRNNSVPFEFQLVNKQVDISCDGIMGRDFFLRTKAQICYVVNAVTLRSKREKVKSKKVELKGKM